MAFYALDGRTFPALFAGLVAGVAEPVMALHVIGYLLILRCLYVTFPARLNVFWVLMVAIAAVSHLVFHVQLMGEENRRHLLAESLEKDLLRHLVSILL